MEYPLFRADESIFRFPLWVFRHYSNKHANIIIIIILRVAPMSNRTSMKSHARISQLIASAVEHNLLAYLQVYPFGPRFVLFPVLNTHTLMVN